MPLVKITVRDTRPATTVEAIGDAVHDALVETMRVPADDRFQIHARVSEREFIADAHFLGIARHDPVCIEITLRAGRTDEMKRALYRGIVARAHEAGVRPADVMIVLHENGNADWSFGEGNAQYLNA